MKLTLLCVIFLATACGTFRKMAVRSTSPLFNEASSKLTQESNWEFFRAGAPANLKFMELLALQDEKNLMLKGTLVKGYAGYAFGVWETLALEDQLKGVDDSQNVKESIFFYTRALDFGLEYLKIRRITRDDLLSLPEEKLLQKLKDEIDSEDFEATIYTAQAWGSLINLQKDNIALVAQVPRVKILFDYVCGRNPKIEFGICDIFQAQYEASRPRMLGGNPEKAKELFISLIQKNPKHFLIRTSYMQSLLIPGFEKEAYEKEAKILKEEIVKWENWNRDELVNKSEYRDVTDLNLFNAIAKKRLEIIERNKAKIF